MTSSTRELLVCDTSFVSAFLGAGSRPIAETWARLKANGERRGLTFGVNDLWIAATGHARGATVLTCDRGFMALRELGVKVVYVPRRPLGQRPG